MKYRLEKQTKPTLTTFGKFRAKAVHVNTIESRQLLEEMVQRNHSGYKVSDLKAILISLSAVIREHLRNGDKVKLEEFGLMKLEIVSDKVDKAEDFKPKKHIKGVRLHFIPESREGSQAFYEDIEFEKDKRP